MLSTAPTAASAANGPPGSIFRPRSHPRSPPPPRRRSRAPPRRPLALPYLEGNNALRIHYAICRALAMNRASADPVGDRRMSGRRHPVPMLYEERSSESRSGTFMSEIDRDLIPSREEARLLKRPRLRRLRIYRALRSRRRNQVGRSEIAAREARPLPETLWPPERRPRTHRPRLE
jgi:hypothetical protein